MPDAYPSSAHIALVEVNFRGGSMIKTLTRLKRTNPSIGIDRMDDYQATHHEISDAQCISFVCTQ